jgi:hypothetical protein
LSRIAALSSSPRPIAPTWLSSTWSRAVDCDEQIGGAPRRRGPLGEPRIVVDDPVERVLHLDEGGRQPCITVPSDISPERYFGAHRITGMTEAMTKLPCDTNIVRMYCPAIFAHVVMTLLSSLSRPPRSSFSPPRIAMLSPYSRTRVSAKRNSASTWFFRSAVGTKLPGDQHHQPADDDAVDHDRDDEIAGDKELSAADIDVEVAADRPQHAHERHRREQRAQDADREIDRLLGRDAGILAMRASGFL